MDQNKNPHSPAMNIFGPPAAARAARTLDRSLFSRILPTAAASVRENRLISKYRQQLTDTRELFALERLSVVVPDPDPTLAARGGKCFILQPKVIPTAPETWSLTLQEASKAGDLTVVPYELPIGYDMWSYLDVIKSILPEELQDEVPSGFNTAGHVAHLNLREQYMPYRHIIAQVLIDKNPTIRTVINKTDNVGTENEFRTFAYEVLAGPDDMRVEVAESGCTFSFDYSKVYWNSKLMHEHQRLVDKFRPGEVVADVMAGIGPFAVPAGKKGVFVWANDKNPESFRYLGESIRRNRVTEFVRPFNQDGHDFVRNAADDVLEASRRGDHALVQSTVRIPWSTPVAARPKPERVPVPPTIAHFVMNLPASAPEFLHNFLGLYHGHEELFSPRTQTRLPMVHVHCFAVKSDDEAAVEDICRRIHAELGVRLRPGPDAEEKQGEVTIHQVRDVAPNKRMFCASFRLPPEVAFAPRVEEDGDHVGA